MANLTTTPAATATASPVADAAPEAGSTALDPATRGVAIGLLVLFVVAIVAMFLLRSDAHWDRLVYVFGGLEAIVFASAGALFGTTVQRGTVTAAKAETERARADATQAEAEAKSAGEDAAKGQALAAAVKAVGVRTDSGNVGQPPSDDRYGGRPDPQLADQPKTETALSTLVRVASELFPD